jgi:hypothetical protein
MDANSVLAIRATLQETFVKSLGCSINTSTDSANQLRDAFEVVANRLLQLPHISLPDKEVYRAAAEKAAEEEAFLATLQSPKNYKQRREETKLAFETAERQKIETEARWEANQARMMEEKRLLGLEGGARVFNAFADMDGADDDDGDYGFGVDVDEDGYRMGALLGGSSGALTDAQREQIFLEESLKARQEAMLTSPSHMGPSSTPTVFKVKAKDVRALRTFILLCHPNV